MGALVTTSLKVLEDLQRFEIKEKAYEGLKNELELKTHEAQLVEERLGRSVAGQLMTEVRRLGEELNVKLPMVLEAAKKQREVWEEKLKELEREGDGGNARDRAMETAERNLQVTKERHEELMSALREKKESIEKLIVEMDSIRSEIEAAKENLMTLEESVAKMEAECAKLKAEVTTVRRRFDEEKEHFEGERSKLAENDQRIGAMTAERNRLTERLEESSLELKRMEHQHKTMTKDHVRESAPHSNLPSKHQNLAYADQPFLCLYRLAVSTPCQFIAIADRLPSSLYRLIPSPCLCRSKPFRCLYRSRPFRCLYRSIFATLCCIFQPVDPFPCPNVINRFDISLSPTLCRSTVSLPTFDRPSSHVPVSLPLPIDHFHTFPLSKPTPVGHFLDHADRPFPHLFQSPDSTAWLFPIYADRLPPCLCTDQLCSYLVFVLPLPIDHFHTLLFSCLN